jgi:hypothetical protein
MMQKLLYNDPAAPPAPDGGAFTSHSFFHAWLQLRSSACAGSFFQVY